MEASRGGGEGRGIEDIKGRISAIADRAWDACTPLRSEAQRVVRLSSASHARVCVRGRFVCKATRARFRCRCPERGRAAAASSIAPGCFVVAGRRPAPTCRGGRHACIAGRFRLAAHARTRGAAPSRNEHAGRIRPLVSYLAHPGGALPAHASCSDAGTRYTLGRRGLIAWLQRRRCYGRIPSI